MTQPLKTALVILVYVIIFGAISAAGTAVYLLNESFFNPAITGTDFNLTVSPDSNLVPGGFLRVEVPAQCRNINHDFEFSWIFEQQTDPKIITVFPEDGALKRAGRPIECQGPRAFDYDIPPNMAPGVYKFKTPVTYFYNEFEKPVYTWETREPFIIREKSTHNGRR